MVLLFSSVYSLSAIVEYTLRTPVIYIQKGRNNSMSIVDYYHSLSNQLHSRTLQNISPFLLLNTTSH